jgi:hypothetical protein
MPRSNLQIKVGSYAGTGVAQDITGIGFRPDFVFIKATTFNAPFRTKHMRGDATSWLASTNAHLTNYITALLADGFKLGTGTNVNSNGVTYYYVAMRGSDAQNYFRVGRYYGDGADGRNFTSGGLGFTPDLVIAKQDGATQGVFRSSAHVGDLSSRFDPNSSAADQIQNLQANGFQLGADARVNTAAGEYFFAALKTLSGVSAVGTFTGDASASRAITGLGFKPDCVIVKANGTTGARLLTSAMVTNTADSTYMNTTASDTTGILSLDSDGFTVGASDSVNKAATNIIWMAFKQGNFNVPLTRTAV